MLSVVLAPFIAAGFAPLLVRLLGHRASLVLALVPAVSFAWLLARLGEATPGVLESTPWVPGLDVALDFSLDGLSLIFSLLISGIGTLIVLYAGGYLKGHPMLGRFFLFLMMFMGAMQGVVLTDNVVTLFVFWELTSLASYLLVGFESSKPAARRAALQALLITATGGLALLAGLIMLANAGGSWRLSDLIGAGAWIQDDPLYLPILVLVVLGCFTKSAQWPFHSWLPGAMQAPTPVSAYLHSATMVKAGVYLLARLDPALGGSPEWLWVLTGIGGLTMLMGVVFALLETDLKLVLAWTTVSALGTLVFLLGPTHEPGVKAAMAFLLVHALYKGALFMAAGNVDHEAGTRDLTKLGGLMRAMPITFAAAAVASVSMAGLPFGLGWVAKELIGAAKIALEDEFGITVVAATLTNLMLFCVAAIVAIVPFTGRSGAAAEHAHEAPWSMLAGPVVLSSLGLVFGMAPNLVADSLIAAATTAIIGRKATLDIVLFKAVDWKFLLTLATFAAGALLFALWRRSADRWRTALNPTLDRGPDRGYDHTLAGLAALATWQTRILQPGLLHRYMAASFAVVALAVAATLARGDVRLNLAFDGGRLIEWAVFAVTAASALVAAFATTRLLAVTALGMLGLGVALIFMLFGAPDLAITQFMVETLLVVILALVLIRLPGFRLSAGADRPRWLYGSIAAGTGAIVTLLLLGVLAEPFDPRLSEWFGRTAVPEAFGHNIVNVILVDFRALDTLGEIIVVFAAALAALAAIGIGARARR
jgi:multicomponent Na+:H+ antiporter subunit A